MGEGEGDLLVLAFWLKVAFCYGLLVESGLFFGYGLLVESDFLLWPCGVLPAPPPQY